MPAYRAPLTDIEFLLNDWLQLPQHFDQLNLTELDAELAKEVLSQGAKFAEQVLAPLNREGDEQSCKLENGKVTTPDGFAAAYADYIANGWASMLGAEEHGGQNLPYALAVPIHEMINAANLSWRLIGMLSESTVLALTKHGTEEQQELYLPKLVSGEWTGTMCLTEPQAGTDLSLLNTKAEPQGDGSYKISGSKIFISGGDQDWSENILHLVLARLPDAPAGVKGISLFLVPKIHVNAQGNLAEPNSLSVGSLEKKMGIKGCPTCVMNFDGATGYLVGAPHQGLACMFTMMNDARFQVGMQGLGAADAAYQGALEYAKERLQSRAPQGTQQTDAKADAIIHQPDVRRMLLTQKALTEGCRALSLLFATLMDQEKFGSGNQAAEASQVIAFLTPICKAFMTDVGVESSHLGIQVYGGHGYIREWGMEQLLRDARICQLYEGTNGIQALDLIGRKLVRDGGAKLEATYQCFHRLIEQMQADQDQATSLLNEWRQTSESLLDLAAEDMAAAAHDYLQYSAYCLIGVLWLSMADAAVRGGNKALADAKQKTCGFYLKRLLPRKDQHKNALPIGADDLLALKVEHF